MTDTHPIFQDDDWRDAITADDPDYPEIPDWLARIRDRRREGRHG